MRLSPIPVYYVLLVALLFSCHKLYCQEGTGRFYKDAKTGCQVWLRNDAFEDSISWVGSCMNNLADGKGVMTGYHHGQAVTKYSGTMKNGRFQGQGIYSMPNNMVHKGNFNDGEILDLSPQCLANLKKHVIFTDDSLNDYVNDNDSREIYYQLVLPRNPIGVVVLIPGTWQATGHVLSSNRHLCELAFSKHLAILVPSINQRLVLRGRSLDILNTAFSHAIKTYNLPKDKFILGGFSMGGLFSIRYAEIANMDSTLTVIRPRAVFSVDGPVDLAHLYRNFQNKYNGDPYSEPGYGMRELRTSTGGVPDSLMSAYIAQSAFSYSEKNGGNARYLSGTPLRIYTDVDVNWWMDNRGVDMYDMNALDQSAMVLLLRKMGNTRAEFINAYQKGYRLEGFRHPHSWSIVNAEDCIAWILKCLG